MQTEKNKNLVRRMFDEAFNQGNTAFIHEIIAPDYIDHSPIHAPAPGPEGFAIRAIALRNGFVEEAQFGVFLAENDLVAFTWTFQGVHHGLFAGMAATGKRVTLSGINVERLENAKIVEHWSHFDLAGLLQQMNAP